MASTLPPGSVDFSGMKIGKLDVVRFFDTYERKTLWVCTCPCKNRILATFDGETFSNYDSGRCTHSVFNYSFSWLLEGAGSKANSYYMYGVPESAPEHVDQDNAAETIHEAIKTAYNSNKGPARSKRTSHENYIGTKWNSLTVVGPTEERKNRTVIWEFKCECGEIVLETLQRVSSGTKKSCGCVEVRKLEEALRGSRSGKLTFVKIDPNDKRTVICKCDCGETVPLRKSAFVNKHFASCGCAKRGRPKKTDEVA